MSRIGRFKNSMYGYLIFYIILTWSSVCLGENNTTESATANHKINRRATTLHRELTDVERKIIVDKHNELRRIVNPRAADMLKMSWDDGLERLAADYTKGCIYEHNKNRKLDGFSYVGENLYISYGFQVDDKYGANAVVSWDNEKHDYTYDTGYCTPGKPCGHYTQTAWAQSYKVGCGMTTCEHINVNGDIWNDATLFACNYAPGGNIQGRKPYTKGTSCSQCAEKDTCDDRLCSNPSRGDELARVTTTTAQMPGCKDCTETERSDTTTGAASRESSVSFWTFIYILFLLLKILQLD